MKRRDHEWNKEKDRQLYGGSLLHLAHCHADFPQVAILYFFLLNICIEAKIDKASSGDEEHNFSSEIKRFNCLRVAPSIVNNPNSWDRVFRKVAMEYKINNKENMAIATSPAVNTR